MRFVVLSSLLTAAAAGAADRAVDPTNYAAVASAISKNVDNYSGYRDVTGPEIKLPNRGRPLFTYAVGAITKDGPVFAFRVEGEFSGTVSFNSVAAAGKTFESSQLPSKLLGCGQWGCVTHVGITFIVDRETLTTAAINGLAFRVYTDGAGPLDFNVPAQYMKAVEDGFKKLQADKAR